MSNVRRIAAVAVAVYLLLVLLDRFVLVELFVRRTIGATLLVLAEALAIVAIGFALRVRRPDFARLDLPTDFLLGYPIFGTICFLVGAMRVSLLTMIPLLVVFGVAGLFLIVRAWEEGRLAVSGFRFPVPEPSGNRQPETGNQHLRLADVAIILILLCGLVTAQAPPVSLDELSYHLAIPRVWANEGRAIELPLISHSYFPLGIESADLPLLTILGSDGGVASHFLHFLAALATIALIRRRTGSALATAAIVTTPALANTIGWSLVDWPLLGICVVLFAAIEDDDTPAITTAVAAGLLTKYTFIPFAIIALALAKRAASSEQRAGVWSFLLAARRSLLPGFTIGSVFFVRNLVLTGNPLAPFFGPDAPHVSGYRGAPFLSDYVFDGAFIDESLGASLLIAAVLARGRVAWALFAGGVGLFLLAPSARLLVPFFAVAAMTAAPALKHRAIAIVVAIAVALQTFLVVYYTDRNAPFALLAARQSEGEYIAQQRPSFSSINWLDKALPAESRTLVVGLNETYWFRGKVRGGGNFDGARISRYLDAPTPESLRAKLKADGITHVAVISPPPPATEVQRKIEERQTRLAPTAQRMLAVTLDRYASSVATRGDAALFTLR